MTGAKIIERQQDRIETLTRENERLRVMMSRASNGDEECITTDEAARLLCMSAKGLRQLARDGEVPGARKVGQQWRFLKAALIDWKR